jgi:hypothetical protein
LKEYNALMEKVCKAVEAVGDATTANAAARELGKLPQIWDSALKARAIFGKKAKELGLSYDKANKRYCGPIPETESAASSEEEGAA